MKTRNLVIAMSLGCAVGFGSSGASATERMIGVTPSDGVACLVKAFPLQAGTTVLGAQFESNDASTVFPEVSLIRGPLSNLTGGTQAASQTSVTGGENGVVTLTWTTSVVVTQADVYYLAIRIPSGPGKTGPGAGPGIGASGDAEQSGSFLASGTEGELGAIRADLAINLVTSGENVGVGGGPNKAGGSGDDPATPAGLPAHTFLVGARPNPAQTSATIQFGLAQATSVTMGIYDVAGRLVQELIQGPMQGGLYHQDWDGRDGNGRLVAPGVYFIRLQTGKGTIARKLVKTR